MIVQAIRNLLLADARIPGEISTYDFGAGAAPAVFTIDPIPKNATMPAIIITQPSGVSWGTMDKRGAEVDIDVRCYADKGYGRSTRLLRGIAWHIWDCLDWAEFDMDDFEHWGCFATGPPMTLGQLGTTEDPEGFPGYLITLMARVMEK